MSDKIADPTREIKMGSEVRDTVTGVEGIINANLVTLNGMFQWSVQPRGDGKDIPEGWNIDPVQLEWIGEGLESRASLAEPTELALGDEVEDIVNGFRGVVTQRSEMINGCVMFRVEAPMVKEPKETLGGRANAPYQFNFAARFKKVEPEKVAASPRSRSGGLSTRMERI